jgi:hypothetical protein
VCCGFGGDGADFIVQLIVHANPKAKHAATARDQVHDAGKQNKQQR